MKPQTSITGRDHAGAQNEAAANLAHAINVGLARYADAMREYWVLSATDDLHEADVLRACGVLNNIASRLAVNRMRP